MTAKVMQWQMVTPEPVKAAAFYEKVFGWTIRTDNALGYRSIDAQPPGIAGGIWPAPPGTSSFVQMFVEVDDVEACINAAQTQGAQVVVPRSALPDGDVMAVLRDPVGVTVGLMQRR